MKTIPIDRDAALKEYQSGDTKVKEALAKLCGAKAFQPVMERIKSFEDACMDQGLSAEEELYPFTLIKDPKEREYYLTHKKLSVIAKSLQDGFVADYGDGNQRKWWVWLVWRAGVGFVVFDTYYGYTFTYTGVGSRFAFGDEKTARYFVEQFIEEHRIILS